jgi:hypothetical protein
MKIEKVSFSKLVSTDNYSNYKAGAEALVEPGETPEVALLNLAAWVAQRLRDYGVDNRELRSLQNEVEILDNRKTWYENELRGLTKKIELMKAFLEKHGVDIEAELPF